MHILLACLLPCSHPPSLLPFLLSYLPPSFLLTYLLSYSLTLLLLQLIKDEKVHFLVGLSTSIYCTVLYMYMYILICLYILLHIHYTHTGDTCCNPISIGSIMNLIKSKVPGIYIHSIEIGNTFIEDMLSGFFTNSNTQIDMACSMLSADTNLKNGFNAMGFSQGGQFL